MSKYYVRRITNYKINHLLSAEVTLYRPKFVVLKILGFIGVLLLLVLGAFGETIFVAHGGNIEECSPHEFLVVVLFWGAFFVALMSAQFSILMIQLYQRYASASTRLRCRCIPSCSQYALIAFKKYGMSYGCYKMLYHLKMCERAPFYEFP